MIRDLFNLEGRVAVITGGGGLLGYEHAAAVASEGGIPVLLDIDEGALIHAARRLESDHGITPLTCVVDITDASSVLASKDAVMMRYGRVDILINNAARNPKVEELTDPGSLRLEQLSWDVWRKDLDVGLGGAFNCSKIYGACMAASERSGVIVNIASDLGVIAPDQRLYRLPGVADECQPVKPITYSVVKHGLVGLTRYLATYWCDKGIRCNALSPGGVYTGQDDQFVTKLTRLIPMGRMAQRDEYRGAIIFLCSDASSYLNGANLIVDGGRSVW